MAKASESVVGVILAGGLARRMGGGDKCLLPLAGKTLLAHTIDRAKPQVAALMLNANGDSQRFAHLNLPIVADKIANNLGPLAGIHSGLQWMRDHTSHQWLASFPCDTPFFPLDLVEKLFQKTQDPSIDLVVATSNQQTQSVFALWHLSLLEKIAAQLTTGLVTPSSIEFATAPATTTTVPTATSGKVPRLQDWIKQQNIAYVEFNSAIIDPFFNINTPEDLSAAESMLANKN